MKKAKRFWNQRGQSLSEYGLILAVILIASVVALKNVNNEFLRTYDRLGGELLNSTLAAAGDLNK